MPSVRACIRICQQDVVAERWRQLKKFGRQALPNGTGHADDAFLANYYRTSCELAHLAGIETWRDVLLEEVYEALVETERVPLRAELVQVAAVAIAWIEDLDGDAGNSDALAEVLNLFQDVAA